MKLQAKRSKLLPAIKRGGIDVYLTSSGTADNIAEAFVSPFISFIDFDYVQNCFSAFYINPSSMTEKFFPNIILRSGFETPLFTHMLCIREGSGDLKSPKFQA